MYLFLRVCGCEGVWVCVFIKRNHWSTTAYHLNCSLQLNKHSVNPWSNVYYWNWCGNFFLESRRSVWLGCLFNVLILLLELDFDYESVMNIYIIWIKTFFFLISTASLANASVSRRFSFSPAYSFVLFWPRDLALKWRHS